MNGVKKCVLSAAGRAKIAAAQKSGNVPAATAYGRLGARLQAVLKTVTVETTELLELLAH